ncbi:MULTISPECIES: sugar transferase [Eubacterium]|uniref:sugar transferase n=1 Tax=Eubacterium TaxID=1730 RepID=UPI001CC3547B|nr:MULTISPECIES: sugar transferase [Eubacterium]
MIYQKYIKCILRFSLSTVGLVILSPVYGILVIAIKADSKGSIFFKQKCVGIHKQLFNICNLITNTI